MKLLLTTMITTATLWAVNATVKYGDVKVTIAGEVHSYKKGEHFEFDYNKEICLSSKGNGLVQIGRYKQIEEDGIKCMTIPSPKAPPPSTSFIKVVIDGVSKPVQDTSIDGVSTRHSVELKKISGDVVVDKAFSSIIIQNTQWDALPLTLKVLNKQGVLKETQINKENKALTRFVIGNTNIENESNLTVTDKLNRMLLEVTVKFKN